MSVQSCAIHGFNLNPGEVAFFATGLGWVLKCII